MGPNKLLFGTAGVPLSTPKRNIINGISHLTELGLDGMELEFVRSVNVGEKTAPLIKKEAVNENKLLTCHGQYYINLSSLEHEKIGASVDRILNAARIANMCGAWSLTFHAAFYQKQDPKLVYSNVKKAMSEVVETLKQEKNPIWIRPETTGKATQFGTVSEIVSLSQEIDNVMPCIDFSHVHARSGGKYNTYEEFSGILDEVESGLGRKGLDNMHIHVSGIEYTEKGERRHLFLEDSDMNYKDLLKALKDYKAKGIVICESPNIEDDALLMKKTYNSI
jgi:deoxyribonuclease-4